MHGLLPRPTVTFEGGPYDGWVVVLDPGHTVAAVTVFNLDGKGDVDYWLKWGRVHSQMFVFQFDPL